MNIQILQQQYRENKNMEFIFFWGHHPSKDGKITKSCLSQWYLSDFSVDGTVYCCMEQYMMAEKARMFNDMSALALIMKNNDPKCIKALGRKVKRFNDRVWDKNRYSIIVRGNIGKFSQNPELSRFLLNTGNDVLAEASPYDAIWGIGMSGDDESACSPLMWKGLNLLGFALMDVRDELRKISEQEN